MKSIIRLIETKPLLSLAFIFAASRAVLYTLFPFRIDFLPWLNQLLDVNLLKNDLWHSLYYLHATPPLYDLYVGSVLSLFPEGCWAIVFTTLQFLMGMGMVLMTYRIARFLGIPALGAFGAGLLFILNPILFRFEIIPFYTYPLAFLILLSVYTLIRLLETSKRVYLIGFLFIALVTLLFRNFFHIVFYFIPIAAGTCYFIYKTRKHLFKTAVIVSIVFFAIGIIPNIRNEMQYGIFSSSTWQGMQLFSITYFVPKDKIQGLINEGSVTPLALIPRFQNPDAYYDYYDAPERSENTVIDALYKSDGVNGNFNNWIYPQAAKEYQKDAFTIIARYPQYLPERLINSIYIYFGIANYRYFDKTNEWFIFDGSLAHKIFQSGKYFVQPALLALLYFCIFLQGGTTLYRAYKGKSLDADRNILLIYILFLLLYVFGVANAVELGENDTARAPIDPIIILMGISLLSAWFRHRATKIE